MAVVTKKIVDSPFRFFTTKALSDIIEVEKASTFHSVVRRLVAAGVLVKVEKGRYLLAGANIHDFQLANLLYEPSYISFESALNFYGMLSQFPVEVTSVTSAKSRQKIFSNKIFSYVHVDGRLFWGYEKKGDFLIALPEKALVDQLYIAAKGLKRVGVDELDLAGINKKRLKAYLARIPRSRQFMSCLAQVRSEVGL